MDEPGAGFVVLGTGRILNLGFFNQKATSLLGFTQQPQQPLPTFLVRPPQPSSWLSPKTQKKPCVHRWRKLRKLAAVVIPLPDARDFQGLLLVTWPSKVCAVISENSKWMHAHQNLEMNCWSTTVGLLPCGRKPLHFKPPVFRSFFLHFFPPFPLFCWRFRGSFLEMEDVKGCEGMGWWRGKLCEVWADSRWDQRGANCFDLPGIQQKRGNRWAHPMEVFRSLFAILIYFVFFRWLHTGHLGLSYFFEGISFPSGPLWALKTVRSKACAPSRPPSRLKTMHEHVRGSRWGGGLTGGETEKRYCGMKIIEL